MKEYPWPCELVFFCRTVAKRCGWELDEALQLLVWNSVIQRWSKIRTMVAGKLLICSW